MYWIIGFITGLGVAVGVISILKNNKTGGWTQLALTALCPVLMHLYLKSKSSHAYGGSDWDYILHSAFVDADTAVWIIFTLFAALGVLMIANIVKLQKNKR